MDAGQRPVHHNQEEHIGRRIALISISAGIFLSIVKIWVGLQVGSASVFSDGLEAGGDVLSSAMVYAGLWLASRPPDYEHPYGHGRYETLAGLGVGAMLLLTGAGIFWNGFVHFGEHSVLPVYAIYPLLAAVIIKVMLAGMKRRVGKQIGSTALSADAWHDLTDLLSTFVALSAAGLTILNPLRFGAADRFGALLIAGIILFLSIQVVRRTVEQLLDTMPDDPGKMGQIRLIALNVPGALGIEKCYARRTGLKYHVDLHLEVDPQMTVRQSHQVAADVKHAIKDELPWVADVLVHVEPSTLSPEEIGRENSTRWPETHPAAMSARK